MAKYLSHLSVIYTDLEESKPDEVVEDINGGSADLNSGRKGKFIWLQPEWTTVKENAISSFQLKIYNTEGRNYNDITMTADTHPDYRYFVPDRDGTSKIVKIGLLRSGKKIDPEEIKKAGFSHYSIDINVARGGDYLYLLWETG